MLRIKNNQSFPVTQIPAFSIDELHSRIAAEITNGKRLIMYFGMQEEYMPEVFGVKLFTALADDKSGEIFVSSAFIEKKTSYCSLTLSKPQCSIFEREFFEEFGEKFSLTLTNHPWLKPVRKNMDKYPFLRISGSQSHEVAVGPVHAGVIEPGHFRFLCGGETVEHLEIQLGYQHRGVEKLFLQKNPLVKSKLAEAIAGDTAIGHNTAYSSNCESLTNIKIADNINIVRAIALELERIAMHTGDLGALANDVAFLSGSSFFGARRTLIINSSLALCGSRFGKGWIRPGGAAYGISSDEKNALVKLLKEFMEDIDAMVEMMFSAPTVLSRFEHTGIVDTNTAVSAGIIGMAGRASGIPLDVRTDHPFGIFQTHKINKIVLDTGDVYCRAYIRYLEIKESLNFILNLCSEFNDIPPNIAEIKKLQPDNFSISMIEGWRGEIIHCAITDSKGNFKRYKIKDTSLHNWFGLALAVRTNAISDFPLCNKSFNLSYCGFDL